MRLLVAVLLLVLSASSFAQSTGINGGGLQGGSNPLAIANTIGAVIAVDVASSTNLTLSGLQTIDGQTGYAGEVVGVFGQTGGIASGFYVMATGAWTRAANFPAGYVIPAFCNLAVLVEKGASFGGLTFRLSTQGGSITIGTTVQSWTQQPLPFANTTLAGVVLTTQSGGSILVPAVGGLPGAVNDCVSFTDTAGSVGDLGNGVNQGPCVVSDVAGHVFHNNASGLPPTASTGTLDTAASDQRGRLTGLSAATTVTITFKAAFGYAPSCGASDSAGTAVGVSAVSTTAVTFTFTALTGSLNYWCF